MDENEDLAVRAELLQRSYRVGETEHVRSGLSRRNVEHKDQNSHRGEDVRTLIRQVRFDKGVLTAEELSVTYQCNRDYVACLPSTVPEVQHEVAHELDVAVLHVDGRAQFPDILRDVILEYDGAHGGFTCAGPAHQQDFALLVALAAAFHGTHTGRSS